VAHGVPQPNYALKPTANSPLLLRRSSYRRRLTAGVRRHVGNRVSVLRVHDSGNSPEANADGCLRPEAVVRADRLSVGRGFRARPLAKLPTSE
jgi:hypothetical protein